MNRISIITISYNSVNSIERTMESVLKQTYRPLEYVLVDGGSKDGTIALIESFLPTFESNGITVNFQSEPDNGISDAFNKGIERSSGNILGIINSDDELNDGVLEKIIEAFNDDISVVCGDCMWVDEVRHLKYVRKSKIERINMIKYEMVLMHPTCFVKKAAYDKWGTFDVTMKYVMDKDLMARFYKNGAKFNYVPEVISIMTAGGVSDINREKVYEEGIEVAVRNGVPRPYARFRKNVKSVETKIIGLIKNNIKIWSFFRK